MDLFTVILYGLIPLIAFTVADLMGHTRGGIYTAMAIAAAEALWMYFKFDMVDPVSVVGFTMICALGFASLKTSNTRFFKFQPVVVYLFLAGFMAYVQLVGPTVTERYGELIVSMLPPDQAMLWRDPEYVGYMDLVFLGAVPAAFIQAVLCGIAAVFWPTAAWIVVRATAIWPLLILFGILTPRMLSPL